MLRLSLICFCLAITQSIAFECKKDGLFKDPENAHKYYNCNNGKASSLPCPDNLVFDESKQACDFDSNAKTVSPQTNTTTSAPTSTQASQTTQASTRKQEVSTQGSTHKQEVTTHGPEVTTHKQEVTTHGPEVSTHGSSADCTGKAGTFTKDPTDPHKFHECVNGKDTVFTCPEHLVFNEAKQVCDFDLNPGTGTPAVEVSTHPQTHQTDRGTQSTPNSHNTQTPGPTGPPQTEGTRQRHTVTNSY